MTNVGGFQVQGFGKEGAARKTRGLDKGFLEEINKKTNSKDGVSFTEYIPTVVKGDSIVNTDNIMSLCAWNNENIDNAIKEVEAFVIYFHKIDIAAKELQYNQKYNIYTSKEVQAREKIIKDSISAIRNEYKNYIEGPIKQYFRECADYAEKYFNQKDYNALQYLCNNSITVLIAKWKAQKTSCK